MTAVSIAERMAERNAEHLNLFRAAFEVELSTTTRMVLLALVNGCRGSGGKTGAPMDKILKMTGLSRAAVFKALAALEIGGHIKRSQRRGHRTTYHVHPVVAPVHHVD
jgi:predicted transcriptional regulator